MIFSLVAAIAVYLVARINPPVLLEPFQVSDPGLKAHAAILGNAPSFFYTLALGLLIGACAPTVARARVHCLIWVGITLGLELTQYRAIAEPVSTWLHNILSGPTWELVGPYWMHGIFDPLDLVATLIGGSIAFILLGHLSKKSTDANVS